jgi:cathepsin D
VAEPVSPPSFPNDGLIGFAGPYQSALNSTSWFQQLCDHDLLAECRFGIAFKTDNTGVQYFGEVATDRFDGPLSVAPVVPNTEWGSWVDIAYDGKVIEEDAMMISDSGTTIIFGLVLPCLI